ncbi:hypothetical protein [Geminocystis sp. NIES-3709]|uniref:hypothetical protein n=1 Tax=Geminocystis sp. NIES-3709 TaxID=1617448 RepID=UPI0005FC4DB6|nr:hypothetical protein [Geminocystis sp. NIES-3709]BAQ65570.1 hypothetical protein GM3709_2335 [Geminocystis sp. NIES-3709]
MFELHKMKDGNSILICQMDDNHLINFIKLLCRKINQSTQILENSNFKGSVIFQALNPTLSKGIKEKAEAQIRYATSTISPYVLEATLRGLNITELLQSAFQRTEQMPSINTFLPLLLSPNINDDDYEDDEEKENFLPIQDEWSNY